MHSLGAVHPMRQMPAIIHIPSCYHLPLEAGLGKSQEARGRGWAFTFVFLCAEAATKSRRGAGSCCSPWNQLFSPGGDGLTPPETCE